MEIERCHRDRDIAKHHYAKALTFYERIGIRFVSMNAENEGPVICSTFGFDFSRRPHRQMLMKVLRDWEVDPLPNICPALAPQVIAIANEANPTLGAQAIEELARRAAEPLPMGCGAAVYSE